MTLAVADRVQSTVSSPIFAPIKPPERQSHPAVFAANFVINPLRSIPAEVYEKDFVRYQRSRLPLVWITDPAYIKMVMLDQRNDFHKLTQQRTLSPLLGNGILTAEGQDWRWQRQTAAPIFRMQDLLPMVPAIVTATERYISRLSFVPSGETRAFDADMTSVTFDVISETLLPGGGEDLREAIEGRAGRFQNAAGWALLFSAVNVPKWVPRPKRGEAMRSIHALRSSVLQLIAKRRASGTSSPDLMQRLMDAKDPETGERMSDEQLVDNLLTFYLAGHETTAKALTWTLYLLSRAPDWEAKLLEEVRRVAGDAPLTAADLDQLVLTEQVVKEAMRLFPPAPLFGRHAMKDVKFGPHDVKAGTQVIVPIYAIQRHKKYFTDPDRFDPARFAPEMEAKMSRYQYMPFGAGPRICIGMAFAMMEAKLILATLVRAAKFQCAPTHNPEPVARVTLVPRGGMPMRVTRR